MELCEECSMVPSFRPLVIKLVSLTVLGQAALQAMAQSVIGGQGAPKSAPSDEYWKAEPAEAIARFVELKKYEGSVNVRDEDKGKPGYTSREEAWGHLVDGWTRFINDFPKSRLVVHAHWRLGGLYTTQFGVKRDYVRASQEFRRAFELYPEVVSVETILSRTNYASCAEQRGERASLEAATYCWLKANTSAPANRPGPEVNSYGYFAPELLEAFGPDRGSGGDRDGYVRELLQRLLETCIKGAETNLLYLADSTNPDVGWTILDQVGDLLPAEVQAKIIAVTGGRVLAAESRPSSPEEGAVAEYVKTVRTVLTNEFASKLPDPDILLPDPTEELTDASVIAAKADARRWIKRMLRKEWWPKTDRPADYVAVRSVSGYDSVYRFWQTGGTAFIVQSTSGWVGLSLRPDTGSTKDLSLSRSEVERKLSWVGRRYLEDPHKVLRDAKMDLAPRPYGYEGRLRVQGDLARRLDEADPNRQFEWLRRMQAHSNGTSFLFRFAPKTDAKGMVQEDRKEWFGKGQAQAQQPAATQSGR